MEVSYQLEAPISLIRWEIPLYPLYRIFFLATELFWMIWRTGDMIVSKLKIHKTDTKILKLNVGHCASVLQVDISCS